MSSWLEAGRPAITEAVAAACDRLDQRARAELEDRDRKNQQLFEELKSLRSRVADVERLQLENESLKAQIGPLRNTSKNAASLSLVKRVALGEVSLNKPVTQQRADVSPSVGIKVAAPDPVKYKKVIAKCKSLDSKLKDALNLLQDHRIIIKKRRDDIAAWARYSDSQEQTIQMLRARLKIRPSSTARNLSVQGDETGEATSVDEDADERAIMQRPSPMSSFEREPPSSPPVGTILRRHPTHLSPKRPVSEPLPHFPTMEDTLERTDSDKIQDHPPETILLPAYSDVLLGTHPIAVKMELSSDGPVFVSAQSVRKRKYRDGEPKGRVQRIKTEHSSSSGPEITHEHPPSPTESIDYDQELHVPTPRKRKALPEDGHESSNTTLEQTPRSRLPFTGEVASEAASITVPSKSHLQLHGARSSKSREASMRLSLLPDYQRSGQAAEIDISISSNVFDSPFAFGRMDLSEDGDADLDRPQRPVMKERLEYLLRPVSMKVLDSSIWDGPSKIQTPRPRSAHDAKDGDSFSAPSKFNLSMNKGFSDILTPIPKHSTRDELSLKPSVGRERPTKKPSILRDDMPRGRFAITEQTQFRDRPVASLRPEHFKPNPAYNDNVPYVYDEVVRGRDARAALSGCIDPNCCGKIFRHFAETELRSIGHSLTSRSEEVILMEQYLGDDSFMLTNMMPEERAETWLKAKTWDLANKFGKHRQRYSRMPSPPGFWNVDFPNTQERAEERRQSEEILKALVAERHREAMKCNGAWLFRDE